MAHPKDGRRQVVTSEEAETAFEDAGTFEAMAAVAADAIRALEQYEAWERFVEARYPHVVGPEHELAKASPMYHDRGRSGWCPK